MLDGLITQAEAHVAELKRLRAVVAADDAPSQNGLDAVEAKVLDLRIRCEGAGFGISGDGYVSEKAAAMLVRRSTFTLRNWRDGRRPLPCRKLNGRWEYDLAELARLLADAGE
jgi:hypothetical protein